MSRGQLFFSDNAARTSVLGEGCSLNCQIWDPVQWNILCFSFFLNMPAHLSSRTDYDPLLIDSFVLSASLSHSACLLLCSAICTHWQSKPRHPPPHPIVFCLVLFFVLSPQLLEKEGNVNSLGQGLQQFGYKMLAARGSVASCLTTASGSFTREICTKQGLLKSWIYIALIWAMTDENYNKCYVLCRTRVHVLSFSRQQLYMNLRLALISKILIQEMFCRHSADVESAGRAGPSGWWASRLTIICCLSMKGSRFRDKVEGKPTGAHLSLL